MFENKKIFVFGMAKSGYEAAKLLSKHNNKVLITDSNKQNEDLVSELEDLGVNFIQTTDPLPLLDDSFDYIVKNPGIRNDHELILKANKLNIPVINEMEMAYHFLPKEVKIIGVTGSNGKTTTVTIMYECLKKAGLPVILGGNIGIPLSAIIEEVTKDSILVLEISDHQLHNMYDFKTNISVVTNLVPTHLDFNKTYENYKNIKKRIFNNHTSEDIALLNKENSDVLEISKNIPSKKMYFSSTEKADCYMDNNIIYYEDEAIINTHDIRVKGVHNYENIMCCIVISKLLGVENEVIKNVLTSFGGVEHRLEFVKKVNNREFYNDSKSTNPTACKTALSAFKTPVILILGGLEQNHDWNQLNDSLEHVKCIVALGECREKIKEYADSKNIECFLVDTMEEVVKVAYNLSEEGDTILLSPACASWDMYPNFEIRGKDFKDNVEKL